MSLKTSGCFLLGGSWGRGRGGRGGKGRGSGKCPQPAIFSAGQDSSASLKGGWRKVEAMLWSEIPLGGRIMQCVCLCVFVCVD